MNKTTILDECILFLLLYTSSSFVFISIKGTIVLLTYIVISFFCLIVYKNRIRTLGKYFSIMLCLFLINILLTALVNQEGLFDTTIVAISFYTALTVWLVFPERQFVEAYTGVLRFICVYSLITFSLSIAFPGFFSFLPSFTNSAGVPVKNAFFSFVNFSLPQLRNFGIFWEPGAFQTFILFALFYSLFFQERRSVSDVIIFTLSLLTTFSTTGYLSGVLLGLAYFFHVNKNSRFGDKVKATITLFSIASIIVIAFYLLPSNLKYQLFGKVFAYFVANGTSNTDSTMVRVLSVVYPSQEFVKSPFLGIGYQRLQQLANDFGYNGNTCTPINWFAIFGLFTGFFLNAGYVLFAWRKRMRICSKIFSALALFLAVATEDFSRNPSIFIFVLIGLWGKEESEMKYFGTRNGK
jgi:hypothetical protein